MTLPRVSDWLLRRYKWKSFGQDAFIKTTLRHIILVLTWNFVTVNISQRTDPLLHGSRIGTRVTALVLCAVGLLAVLETDLHMCAVAEWLVTGSPASAQGDGFLGSDGLAPGIDERAQPADKIRAVGFTSDGWRRIRFT